MKNFNIGRILKGCVKNEENSCFESTFINDTYFSFQMHPVLRHPMLHGFHEKYLAFMPQMWSETWNLHTLIFYLEMPVCNVHCQEGQESDKKYFAFVQLLLQ